MSRTVLSRWNRPEQKVLEQVFPAGKPPFDPFPSVTELINAYYCPLAIYHYLHHAEEGAFTPRTAIEGWRSGETFHSFIEQIKTSLIEGRLKANSQDTAGFIGIIRSEFTTFSRHLDKPGVFWQQYFEPWLKRKANELMKLGPNSQNYFETTVANYKIPFQIKEGGTRTYPLTGRIDEIDIDNKRIIERTIKSTIPPKDYQVWLLWKILCSIDKNQYPDAWKNINFNQFDLVVETPAAEDYIVEKNNPEFEHRTHECYAWIHDLTFGPKAVAEAYANRACTYENRREDCGLSWMCYARRQPFPEARGEMRRTFKDIYRALLWEKMWGSDLFQYRFLALSEQELEERGLTCKGTIVPNTRRGRVFQVKIPPSRVGLISARATDDIGKFLIVFGNFFIGRTYKAKLERKGPDLFSVETEGNGGPLFSNQPLIANVDTDFFVFEERPTYLIANVQRDMHRLEYRGVKSPEKAQADSKIQLLESIFGDRQIKKGREEDTS